ncbi:basic amino acid ABC transporter substrate-binding protein [Collimonas fungivorans]|uniref:basic amino acid ABC transporter substrate-binding protein n=1 Tax=Collimonas fungivorans TaxID=158899 RepID=UPI003FA3B2C9
MKIRLLHFLTVALLAIGLCACEKPADTAPTPKVYRVGMNAAFAPFGSVDTNGKIVGFDVDIMQAVADQAGIKIVWVNTPWEGIFSTLANADIDIIASGVTITDERKQSMLFSDPYFEAKQVILVSPGKNIGSPDDLKQAHRVGVTAGTSADTIMQKMLGKTSNALVRFESLPLLLKEVDNGGVDAAVGDNGAVANHLKFNKDKGFKLIESDRFEKEYYGIAVRPADTDLLAKINGALKTLHSNGSYDKIYATYFAR